MAHTKDFAEYIRAKLAANPDLAEAVETESFNADIATKVYEARHAAGLSQKQLAERIGTQQSVISRIEDADYDGHSLTSLKKIAQAIGKKLRVEFQSQDMSGCANVTQILSVSCLVHQHAGTWAAWDTEAPQSARFEELMMIHPFESESHLSAFTRTMRALPAHHGAE